MTATVTEIPQIEIPGFRIEKEIGRGGMARVYLAVQRKFGRLVALKVVSSEFTRDSKFKERFIRESRINARLTHPNIVQVYDVGTHEDALYLVMEYVRGGDLNQRLERGMHLTALIRLMKDMCRALDYAHEKGFVHRDIKPENILFREDGGAVLSDFGIARFTDAAPSLTLCPDCGKTVSFRAGQCPHCGCPAADVVQRGTRVAVVVDDFGPFDSHRAGGTGQFDYLDRRRANTDS